MADAQTEPEKSVEAAPEMAGMAVETADALGEFRGGGDDASMEETLAAIKEDPSTVSGHSLLDSTQEEPHAEAVTEADSMIEAEMAAEADRLSREVEAEANFDTGEGVAAEVPPTPIRKPASRGVAKSIPAGNADGALSMVLTGNMTLNLKYEFGGQDVVVQFKDQFLIIQLVDGTEFKIPVGNKKTRAA
jgi:hypothetical protein